MLGTVGETGWSEGPRLHYSVWRKGPSGELAPVDPRLHMLDLRWPDDEDWLRAAASFRPPQDYERLPRSFAR